MMRTSIAAGLIMLLAGTAGGCSAFVDGPTACPAIFVIAMNVTVTDSISGQVLHHPGTVVLTASIEDGSFTPDVFGAPAEASYTATVGGSPGVYDLTASHAGYQSRSRTVTVPSSGGACLQPVTQYVSIRLPPS